MVKYARGATTATNEHDIGDGGVLPITARSVSG
jgi:hypothetical protein